MITDTLLILERKDLLQRSIDFHFSDITLNDFPLEINELALKAGLVVFKDDDLQTKLLKSRYLWNDGLKISTWKYYSIKE